MNNISKKIYLIRHGEPIVQDGKKFGLSTTGISQVAKRAGIVDKETIGVILTSPSLRCVETAEILSHLSQRKPRVIIEKIRLLNADNINMHGIQSKYSFYMNNFKKYEIESPNDYIDRFKKIVMEYPQQNILIVANEVSILLLMKLYKNSKQKTIDHTEVSVMNVR